MVRHAHACSDALESFAVAGADACPIHPGLVDPSRDGQPETRCLAQKCFTRVGTPRRLAERGEGNLWLGDSSFAHASARLGEVASLAGVRGREMEELGVGPDRPRDRATEEVGLGRRDLVDVLLVLLGGALRQVELQFVAVSRTSRG